MDILLFANAGAHALMREFIAICSPANRRVLLVNGEKHLTSLPVGAKPAHWLVEAALSCHPDKTWPSTLEVSDVMAEAWPQVHAALELSSRQLAEAVAQFSGLEAGDLRDFRPEDGTYAPEALCREFGVLPLWTEGQFTCLAVSDPRLGTEQLAQLRFACRKELRVVVMSPEDIDTGLTRLFARSASGRESSAVIDLLASDGSTDAVKTVRLAKAIFQSALDRGASDIHIHPFVGGGVIRFRIDGSMRRIATIPADTLAALARYLKANAGLDPNPLKPQDGRLRLAYGHRATDVRLSILPVADGDRIVCRLLEQGRNFSLKHSGFSLEDNHALRRLIAQGAGMVLLTGPTGSGKTSTLYALLSELNRVDVNIITIENPVEYVLPGISQVQVDEQQGRSFADALRSILRQDPDIVLVGEIRDAETARVASQAALTGHLVLSTLHTNDAMSTVPRLLDLGLDPSVLADSLLGVVSQRLVRKACVACSLVPQDPLQPAESEFLRITGERPGVRVTGCADCGYTGYKGRVPIVEVLSVSEGLRAALMSGIRDLRALREASRGHHSDMAHSAARWIVSGRTTPAEIQRVVGMRFWNALAALHGVAAGGSAELALGDVAGAGAFRLLMVSRDEALAQALSEVLPYVVTRVDTVLAAGEALAQGDDLLGLLLDDDAMDGEASGWLAELRSQLAWSGLPALFLTQPGHGGLDETLDRFSAAHADRSAPAVDLAVVVMRMLNAEHII